MSVPNTSELDDDQIEDLIRKLSAIKGSAPELIAALTAEANARVASKSSGSGRSGRNGGSGGRRSSSNPRLPPPPNKNNNNTRPTGRTTSYKDEEYDDEGEEGEEEEGEEEDDDEEETDSEEEDDEFDEDGPCVGYGYSDEASVISEMTTPTVVSSIHVPAEERYDEINSGYGKGKSNKPDLLSQVNRVNAAKTKKGPGLPPDKRKTYTSGLAAMSKISETADAPVITKPKTSAPPPAASPAARATKKVPQRKGSGSGDVRASGRSGGTTRGLRRDKSPNAVAAKPKKPAPTSGGSGARKSNHSRGSGGSGRSGGKKESDPASDAFGGDEWHKSLTSTDFNSGTGMDDNGFPFSFADTENAFAASTTSFFNNKATSGGGETTDPFDPFSNGDPFKSGDAFEASNNTFSNKNNTSSSKLKSSTKATGTRPRRTSAVGGSGRSKPRDGSPRRKGAR